MERPVGPCANRLMDSHPENAAHTDCFSDLVDILDDKLAHTCGALLVTYQAVSVFPRDPRQPGSTSEAVSQVDHNGGDLRQIHGSEPPAASEARAIPGKVSPHLRCSGSATMRKTSRSRMCCLPEALSTRSK